MATGHSTKQKNPLPAFTLSKKRTGRPPAFQEAFTELARRLVLLKATCTQAEMAHVFGVSIATINQWQKDNPSFSEAIAGAKDPADASVANSLFRRANGYDYEEDVVVKVRSLGGEEVRILRVQKHLPPDFNSMSLWLRNRKALEWKAVPEPIDDETKKPISGVSVTIQDPSATKPDAAEGTP